MSNPAKNIAADAPKSGRTKQKARTRRALIEAAVSLIGAGRQPTVTEVADYADISRRTAYRYFPTQEKLHAEAALDGLRPIMESAIAAASSDPQGAGIEARVENLVRTMQRLTIENEPLLRTMIHQTVLERPLSGQPRRGTRRIDWIELTLKPYRTQFGTPAYARLVSSLALCTGIEALLVLKDICGLSAGDSVEVSRWMARAVLELTLSEREAGRRKRKAKPR